MSRKATAIFSSLLADNDQWQGCVQLQVSLTLIITPSWQWSMARLYATASVTNIDNHWLNQSKCILSDRVKNDCKLYEVWRTYIITSLCNYFNSNSHEETESMNTNNGFEEFHLILIGIHKLCKTTVPSFHSTKVKCCAIIIVYTFYYDIVIWLFVI